MAGLHFIRISCFVRAFNKEFHVVHAFHKPYGFMKCHLSHPPSIQRGMVKDSFQGKAQVCRKNPLRPKMLGAEVDVASKTSMDGSWNPSRLSFLRHLVPKTHGLDGDLVAEVGVFF